MKKIISVLCALAMLITLVVLPASAEEKFVTETMTVGQTPYYYFNGNDSTKDYSSDMTIVSDTVDGASRSVIKLADFGNATRDFGVAFPNLTENGTYRLTATYRSTATPAQGRLGIRRGTPQGGSDNNYAGNSPTGTIKQSDTYRTDYVDFTVDTSKQDNNGQFARIRFGSGATGECYIADFKLQKVNDDESLGDNILPPLTERVKGALDGWTLENNPITEDKAVIDYATVNGVYKPVVKWSYSNSNKDFRYWIGGDGTEMQSLPHGKYRISLTYCAPSSIGDGKLGIRNDQGTGFPDNSPTATISQSASYTTVTKDVEVTSDNNQFLDIRCTNNNTVVMYISEVKLQPINDDGTLGDNVIENGDFMVRQYDVNLVTNSGVIEAGKELKSYVSNEETQLPTAITRTGYTFGGWYEDKEFSGSAVTSIPKYSAGDKTYYAKWISEFSDVATAKITKKTSEAQHSSWAIAVTAKKDIKQGITLKIGDKTIMEYPADKSGIAAGKTVNFGVLVRREITAADITVEADGKQIAVE